MKIAIAVLTATVILAPALPGDTKIKMEDLPAAVQNAVRDQTKTATLTGLSKEVEKGKTLYEVETKVNGKGRDLLLDKTGAVVEVEEEVEMNSIPAAAKAAIQKRAIGGSVQKVEKLTQGLIVSYEAAIKTKAGKNAEIGVNADGSVHKE
jgi:uncharacterized membrane protein YkoI